MKKNYCAPINPKKYSCYGLKKFHTRNLITKKNSCGSKIPLPPPITFLMVRLLIHATVCVLHVIMQLLHVLIGELCAILSLLHVTVSECTRLGRRDTSLRHKPATYTISPSHTRHHTKEPTSFNSAHRQAKEL